jgi:uncharacterized protein (DUF736 family)
MSFAGGQARLGASFSQQSQVSSTQALTNQSVLTAPLATLKVNTIETVTGGAQLTLKNHIKYVNTVPTEFGITNDGGDIDLRPRGNVVIRRVGDGNATIATEDDADLDISPQGTGVVNITKDLNVTGDIAFTGTFAPASLTTPLIQTSGTNEDLTLTPNGTGKVTTSKDFRVTSSTASTSTSTGCAVFTGGVGIGGSLYTSGTVRSPNLFLSNVGTANIATLSANADIALTPNGTGKVTTGAEFQLTAAAPVISTSATNADLTLTPNGTGKVKTGAPIELTSASSVISTSATNADLTLTPNGTGKVTTSKDFRVTSSTESTSTSTGCAVFTGGVGCAKNLYVGGKIRGMPLEDTGTNHILTEQIGVGWTTSYFISKYKIGALVTLQFPNFSIFLDGGASLAYVFTGIVIDSAYRPGEDLHFYCAWNDNTYGRRGKISVYTTGEIRFYFNADDSNFSFGSGTTIDFLGTAITYLASSPTSFTGDGDEQAVFQSLQEPRPKKKQRTK